jgi:hypothetical protein
MPEMTRDEAVQLLHGAFAAGDLHVLVGAGTSIASGFPPWDALNVGLLENHLRDDAANKFVPADQLRALALRLYGALGRDAAADFVLLAAPEKYLGSLTRVLYYGREIEDLPLRSIHRQLAALAPSATLYTTNYDPLLELALREMDLRKTGNKNDFWLYRKPRGNFPDEPKHRRPVVHHIHGWIDPNGTSGGTVILTESQYLELQEQKRAAANVALKSLLESGTLLVVGMSFTDPNLRRLVYKRSKDRLRDGNQRVFAVMKSPDPALLYYWRTRDVHIIPVESHDDLPGLMRDVQFGLPSAGAPPPWLAVSTAWIERNLLPVAFSDVWQQAAHDWLSALERQIRPWFALPSEEAIHITLFVPLRGGDGHVYLSKMASSRRAMSGADARAQAGERRFGLDRGREQGVAGHAFGSGVTCTALEGDPLVNQNFPRKEVPWDPENANRDWRSVMAIPMLDLPEWLPVSVTVITSNLAQPFWKRFGDRASTYQDELLKMVWRTAQRMIAGTAR